VWHCHILEHEDNEMMRPLRVLDPGLAPAPAAARTPATEETTVKPADVLALAVPNPVHGAMFMRFSLPATGPIRLEVYDIAGKRVHTLASGSFPAGAHVVEWDGRGDDGAPAASGTYFVRLAMGEQSLVKRFAMVR
jgi:flagellar hook assembly protein FlgD